MDSYKYAIVGGGPAGQQAGEGIRRVDSSGTIALLCGEDHLPYRRPPLSKGYLAGQIGLDRLYLKTDGYYQERGIDVLRGVRAEAVNPDEHRATLADGRVLPYEKLLLATGGRARRLPIPGGDLGKVFTLRTIGDADSIRGAAARGLRALVVGGSFTGTEVASTLAKVGVTVTMVFMEDRLLESIAPPELSASLRAVYEAHGVRIVPGTKPAAFEGRGAVQQARLDSGEVLPVDLVVLGVGIELEMDLAGEAGLELAEMGGVSVDEHLRTSNPDIYAAGDIAAWPDPTFGKRIRVEHWDVARRQGLRAGMNMAGEQKSYETLPYFFSDLFDLSCEVWGDLSSWDKTVRRGNLEKGGFAFFHFAQETMVGALCAGRPAEERKMIPELVRARLRYDEVAAWLQDEGTSLAGLGS